MDLDFITSAQRDLDWIW